MSKSFTFFKLLSISLFVFLFCGNVTLGQVEAWQFGTPASLGSEVTYNATTNDPNLNISVLSRGAGLTPTALGRGFSSTNYTASGTKADAVTNNKYYSFSITANSTYKVSLSTLDAALRRSSTGPNAYIWKYSTDNTTFTDIGTDISFTSTVDGVPQTQISLSGISALQNVVSGTTIYFRLYAWGATQTGGTFAIGRYGTGVTTNSLAIGGTVTPSISSTFTLGNSLTPFSQTSVSPAAEQTYTISGTGVTANVTVTPPKGFEISKTTNSGFVDSTASLVFTAADVIAGRTIYVRMHASITGSYSGNINHASAGSEFLPVSQPVSGTYTNACVLSLTALIQGRYDGSVMIPDTVTAELHDASTFTLVDQNKGLLDASGIGSYRFNTAVNGTNYYIVLKNRNSIETWSNSTPSFSSYAMSYNFTTASSQAYGSNLFLKGAKYCIYTGDVNQDGLVNLSDMIAIDNDNSNSVTGYKLTDLNGDSSVNLLDLIIADNNNSAIIKKQAPQVVIPSPVFTITGTLSSFSQTSANASAEQTYSVSGTNLTANVTLAPPAGFEISKTTISGFVTSSGSLVYTASEVMAGKTIYVRLHAGSPASYSGNITHTSAIAEFTVQNQSVSGTYTSTPVLTITGSLSTFSQTSSTPSAEQTYTIGGTALTANVTLAPPSSFEISKTTGSGFVTSSGSLVYTAAEVMAGKTIYVRMNAASPNSYSGNITHTSAIGEFTVQNKSVSGTYVIISNVNLTMGNPSFAVTIIDSIHNYLLVKPQFCASYNKDRGIPNWTSWQLNSTWANGPAVRKDNYIPDPSLPSAWYPVNDADYSGSGFSRGHMCPSADRVNTQADNDSLFYYTNMVPQNQNNNGGTWEGLEDYERTLADAGNTVYIICGGYGAGGTKTDNSATVNTISNGHVTVPAQLWKVMIVIPNGSGSDISRVTTSTRTIAMIIPNNSVPNSKTAWGTYRVSVDSVEALTGYDFFSNVPTSIQAVIEATVDNGPTQ